MTVKELHSLKLVETNGGGDGLDREFRRRTRELRDRGIGVYRNGVWQDGGHYASKYVTKQLIPLVDCNQPKNPKK
jgi:hypothetical protein